MVFTSLRIPARYSALPQACRVLGVRNPSEITRLGRRERGDRANFHGTVPVDLAVDELGYLIECQHRNHGTKPALNAFSTSCSAVAGGNLRTAMRPGPSPKVPHDPNLSATWQA